jgi:signal transduction histidine kinase
LPKFRPRARIVRTIGDQLISGPEAALIELVKNAYDADSPYVLIWLIPPGNPNAPTGCVFITDEGHGMSPDDVVGKWMEPATDEKQTRRTSPGGRLMLGAKGIGRFAASRLGRFTQLETVCSPEERQRVLTRVQIDWNWFQSATYLDEVEIPLESEELALSSTRKTGVTLEIRELRDLWTRKKLEYLIRELRRVVSPYDTAESGFQIRLDLTAFTQAEHGFNGQELLTGFEFAGDSAERQHDPLLIRPFELQKHADYTLSGSFNQEGAFEGVFAIGRGDGLAKELFVPAPALKDGEAACGALGIRINVYDRETEAVEALFGRMGYRFEKIGIQTARRMLSDNAGIAIFRKGFRIRPYGDPESDWLELERQRVQNPSRKLGLSQVAGVVEIADEHSSGLIERSSREGLEHTESFERLKQLVLNVLLHVEARRYDFRAGAGISRAPKGDLGRVRRTATLSRAMKATEELPPKLRGPMQDAIAKDAAALATEIDEFDEYKIALQSRAALGLVVAEILHEGRRLLNPVSTSAKALLDSAGWVLENSKRGEVFRRQFPEYAATIHDGVTDLGRLFKRLDPVSGRRRGRPRTFSVAEVIKRCAELFTESIERDSVELQVSAVPSLAAYGYEEDLQGALMNLIDNAIYWLSTRTGKRILSIESRKVGKSVVIRVANNGPPIDESYVPSLFDAGFTLKSDGTGLGLAIAREALHHSHGDLTFDDAAEDTTFVIRMRTEAK